MNASTANYLARKVTGELKRIADYYGKDLPCHRAELTHDLALALQAGALRAVTLRAFRPNAKRETLAEYCYHFDAGEARSYLDATHGMGIVPLQPPFDLSLGATFDPPASAIVGLYLHWTPGVGFGRMGGHVQQDGNTARQTGGRASKTVFTSDHVRRRGRIKFYHAERRFGFIISEEGGEVFFHADSVVGFLPRRGLSVSYLPVMTARGMQANDVRLRGVARVRVSL